MKILIPIDHSESAEKTVHWASEFLNPDRTEILLINIYHCSPEGGYRYPTKEESETLLNRARNLLEAKGFTVGRTESLLGGEAETICDYADREGVDQIMMGSHGAGLSRLLTGSVSEEVLKCARKPVFILKNKQGEAPTLDISRPREAGLEASPAESAEKVLIPVDGSEASRKTLEWTADFLDGDKAAILLLNIIPVPAAGAITPNEAVLSQDIDEARQVLFGARLWFERRGFNVLRAEYRLDEPASGICDYADEQDADLIIIGSHGRGGVFSNLFGGVSSKVFSWSQKPVIVFNNAKVPSLEVTHPQGIITPQSQTGPN